MRQGMHTIQKAEQDEVETPVRDGLSLPLPAQRSGAGRGWGEGQRRTPIVVIRSAQRIKEWCMRGADRRKLRIERGHYGSAAAGVVRVARPSPLPLPARAGRGSERPSRIRDKSSCSGSGSCVHALKRDDFSSNRHLALGPWWSMIFFRKPLHTFRDHALAHDAESGLP